MDFVDDDQPLPLRNQGSDSLVEIHRTSNDDVPPDHTRSLPSRRHAHCQLLLVGDHRVHGDGTVAVELVRLDDESIRLVLDHDDLGGVSGEEVEDVREEFDVFTSCNRTFVNICVWGRDCDIVTHQGPWRADGGSLPSWRG
jgi:hypothetical protein